MSNTIHRGGCHCGAVRFELTASAHIEATLCNCSVCRKSGYRHWFIARDSFRLLTDEAQLATYTFGSGVAQHYFCRLCGIKSFYVPRSHPDGYSVNANCIDDGTLESVVEVPFDGRNWEKNVSQLSPLSD